MMLGYGFGMSWIGMLIQLVVIVGVIYLIIHWIKKGDSNERGNDAIHILRQRFARGEISEEEYERMLRVLKK
ncbi:SHOCT domain-containing protein [Fodinisporobacter ferrooxydans]|uniref:SHOCT domain-containing protein n=1 Tax=Fodinisporobacter ferrooxydans TaxID=2901836 RepID=A0ABY4CNM1_9BACL|nr:SHOCT domain-containing protein [Alicyclobacillaceae bacterium MYW30-H2]